MAKTLSDIVSAAFQADITAKTASAKDIVHTAPAEDFLAAELGQYVVKEASEEAPAAKPTTKVASDKEILDDASYAEKIATALERGAVMVQKLAEAPALHSEPFDNASTQSPVAQGPKPTKATVGAAGALPTTDGPGKVASDRGAMERQLRAKVAEYKMLVGIGETEAAKVAEADANKLAGALATSSGGEGNHFPDNEGVRNLTKAQAKDSAVREGGALVGVAPKKDNAVAAHTLRTDGLKVSSDEKRRAGGAIGGGMGGAALATHAAKGKNAPLAAAGGALAGMLAGGAAGKALDKARGAEKKASLTEIVNARKETK